MILIEKLVGFASDPEFAEKIHVLSHSDQVEYLVIAPDETSRRRMRLVSDKGTDCAIALDRAETLDDGAILSLEENRAIVVRMSERKWLKLVPKDKASALELGYFVGNLHWKVEFRDEVICIALEGPKATYLGRLELMLSDGRALLEDDDGQ